MDSSSLTLRIARHWRDEGVGVRHEMGNGSNREGDREQTKGQVGEEREESQGRITSKETRGGDEINNLGRVPP
jgi:hypothetical protein